MATGLVYGMKLTEKQVHFLFKIGVWVKAVDGALEIIGGMALLITSQESLRKVVGWLTQGELQEDPTDFVANHLVDYSHHLSISTKHFASAYLLVYGITKIGLCCGENCGLIPPRWRCLAFFFAIRYIDLVTIIRRGSLL